MKHRYVLEKIDKFSLWERKINENHPIFSQVIAGILAGSVAGWIVTNWASNNIPPNPQAEVRPVSPSSAEVTIENLGYIPATHVYKIATSDTVVPSFSIEKGAEYIKLEDTNNFNVKRAIVERLPKSQIIQLNISGSNKITINQE